MLLSEAEKLIKSRMFPTDYADFGEIIKQADADVMALRCIEAQIRLQNLLNDFWDGVKEGDTFSTQLVHELISSCSIEAKFDEDGIYIPEEDIKK